MPIRRARISTRTLPPHTAYTESRSPIALGVLSVSLISLIALIALIAVVGAVSPSATSPAAVRLAAPSPAAATALRVHAVAALGAGPGRIGRAAGRTADQAQLLLDVQLLLPEELHFVKVGQVVL